MLNKSESIQNLAVALVTFHAEMVNVEKSADNPFFHSKYVPLDKILTAIKEPLAKAGLVFTQFPSGLNQLTTLLVDVASGEYLEATYEMTPAKNDPQGQGSVITYQRRYALSAILGLNSDVDDDGNQASAAPEALPGIVHKNGVYSKPNEALAGKDNGELIIAQIKTAIAARTTVGTKDIQALIDGVERTNNLTAEEKAEWMPKLQQKYDNLKEIENLNV